MPHARPSQDWFNGTWQCRLNIQPDYLVHCDHDGAKKTFDLTCGLSQLESRHRVSSWQQDLSGMTWKNMSETGKNMTCILEGKCTPPSPKHHCTMASS